MYGLTIRGNPDDKYKQSLESLELDILKLEKMIYEELNN